MIVEVPSRGDVLAAAARIGDHVQTTPLLEATIKRTRVWLKAECLQTGGAFKLRGASNRLLKLTGEQRRRGVVAFSSGNHAQGVAIAAKRLGIPAAIVMPADAPALKVEATRASGAEVIFYDRASEDRVAIARALAADRGATLVPSFDDPDIVAGQGTAGMEILEQFAGTPQRILVPTGGGGLAAGIALACPDAEILCVEPEGWDDMRRSLEGGEIVPVDLQAPPTLCDALQTPMVSPITFGILQSRRARGVAVNEREIADAIRFAARELKLIVEPGGAVALAALLSGKVPLAEAIVAVLSGGNIDPALHARIMAEG